MDSSCPQYGEDKVWCSKTLLVKSSTRKTKKIHKNNGDFTKKFLECYNQYISVFGKVENRNQWKKLC